VPQQIDSLLHRRPDLSTFLVHLTAQAGDAETHLANLLSILSNRTIEARNPYGLLRKHARDNREGNPALYHSQLVVCLTETPLEHVWMMCADIADRQHPLAPFGLAFSKPWARKVGANPVWYIDVLRTGREWLSTALNNIAKQTVRIGGERYADPFNLADGADPTMRDLPLERSPIAEVAPFIETMGPVGPVGQVHRREFWWEREWRYRGNLEFTWSDVVAVFAPQNLHAILQADLREAKRAEAEEPPAILDPRWGLERMIAALAGVPDEFAGPLPSYE
jgi:hypothetical protein